MNKIILKDFILEQFSTENIDHTKIINEFDNDLEINR